MLNKYAKQTYSNFNSRTPRGVRLLRSLICLLILKFQLTHPTRSATCGRRIRSGNMGFQLTHPTRSATRSASTRSSFRFTFQLTHPTRSATWFLIYKFAMIKISTHAPHAECDQNAANFDNNGNISTHAPHAECDIAILLIVKLRVLFQLTHPTRSATATYCSPLYSIY